MKYRILTLLISVILIIGFFYFVNNYISNSANYISNEKLKNNLGKEYDELLRFYNKIGIDNDKFTNQIEELEKSLQTKLDKSSFIERINYYFYYKEKYNNKDIYDLLKRENEYIDTLTPKEKEKYIEVYFGKENE